jgi:hypothetical protein
MEAKEEFFGISMSKKDLREAHSRLKKDPPCVCGTRPLNETEER